MYDHVSHKCEIGLSQHHHEKQIVPKCRQYVAASLRRIKVLFNIIRGTHQLSG